MIVLWSVNMSSQRSMECMRCSVLLHFLLYVLTSISVPLSKRTPRPWKAARYRTEPPPCIHHTQMHVQYIRRERYILNELVIRKSYTIIFNTYVIHKIILTFAMNKCINVCMFILCINLCINVCIEVRDF